MTEAVIYIREDEGMVTLHPVGEGMALDLATTMAQECAARFEKFKLSAREKVTWQ